MHEVYEVSKLLKYSVPIESITAYDNYLLVGNRQGHIFLYTTSPRVQLVDCNKTFSKRPILQLASVPECQIVICLSDERVSVLDISRDKVLHLKTSGLQKTKGATSFTLDVKTPVGLQGNANNTVVRLCVAAKRQLQVYHWKGRDFLEHSENFDIPDIPRTMVWCDQTVIIGCKNEYYLFDVTMEQMRPLFLTGKNQEPIITKISDTQFGVVKDSHIIVMSTSGDVAEQQTIKWADSPSIILYDEPYLIASIGDKLNVQTIEPGESSVVRQLISTTSKTLNMFTCQSGLIYASSALDVWCLKAVPFAKQIKRLLEDKNFQLALKLANISDESVDDKEKNVAQIRTLYANDLFEKKKYQESMREFLKLKTDPYDVIRLFPNLLPQNDSDYGEELLEKETEIKIVALIEYLTEVRHNLLKEPVVKGLPSVIEPSNNHQEQLLQIIDTTLLKCYLQTNDALIAPLLRLNHCHLLETEATLKKYKKYSELIILYQTKGLHSKALELLQKQSENSDSNLRGPERTIQYLQNIGSNNIDIILQFSDWVLNKYPEEGLNIFTEDIAEVEHLPRPKVLDFLIRNHKNHIIPYLEHVIYVWGDTNAICHNALIHQYREKLQQYDSKSKQVEQTAHSTKVKLMEFLEQSKYYTPETVLVHFPLDGFFEERAIVLGKLGRHEQVLSMYVTVLNDIDRAISYCDKVYKSKDEDSEQIYVTLLRLLIDPPDSWLAGLGGVTKSAPNLNKVIELLNKNAAQIATPDVLKVLPDQIPLYSIRNFLIIALNKTLGDRRLYQVNRGLLYAKLLKVQQQRILYESQNITLTEFNICRVCKKRFGNQSAFVRCPNGEIVHYSCHNHKADQ
ncbi:vam6/Vps39-like protein isoform X2 [Adelges cooleyi]|nr:vam6/Vps39-like protein isoform X2 [Adelges cooleyi]XP_050430215.1 vam6/Vps39-like protein isoform X2 [Adelges cooleyi]XP_050430216.1 vam6/Vps39-like protein isoform X2 [Adelges cooleyi]XP_050430217.1 vam6/Vps39-like protein isoform X2 [Adelges cooleyi]XP_050430218.1 vam6/Vps39-like protein isoform X2 [Adelges cooleyi]